MICKKIFEYIVSSVSFEKDVKSVKTQINEVLDNILTEKSLYCKDRGIKISCVIDGNQIDLFLVENTYADSKNK